MWRGGRRILRAIGDRWLQGNLFLTQQDWCTRELTEAVGVSTRPTHTCSSQMGSQLWDSVMNIVSHPWPKICWQLIPAGKRKIRFSPEEFLWLVNYTSGQVLCPRVVGHPRKKSCTFCGLCFIRTCFGLFFLLLFVLMLDFCGEEGVVYAFCFYILFLFFIFYLFVEIERT